MPNGRSSTIKVIPSASRLVRSLRDLGYDFPQAVADLVDNSVAADAARIAIDLRFEGPDSWLRIADDGQGMGGDEITEAMRYGSSQSYDDEALGKFGLGLKTASLSQCRRLSVASRRAPTRARMEVRALDLNHVIEADRWEIFDIPARSADARLVEPLRESPGTIVLWESLDRLFDFKIPWGKRAENALDTLAGQLRLHLGMIFHRFLSGEVEGRDSLEILVNGEPVEGWDPFALTEHSTAVLSPADFDMQTEEGFGLVRFQPFVLPSREEFSSEDAFHAHAGPRRWNAQQGFYIYRANRLIQAGGWSRLRTLDEHVKLARASIDFYPELDSAFKVNVAKVRVSLPAELKERLGPVAEPWIRAAQTAYRANAKSELPRRKQPRPELRSALEQAAEDAGEGRSFRRIVRRLRRSHPGAAHDLGW